MKNSLFVLCLLITSGIHAQNPEKNFIDQNYIEVTGKSEMDITPDQIYISVKINERDTKNKTSVAELEKLMINKLKEIGIDVSKDLVIKDIASNYKYYLLSKSDILLSKEYQILVRDGKTAGKVFIELENIGISNVSIERLDNSNMVQYRKEVKINAIKAAKEKAESLAFAINQNIGRAIYIQEFDLNYRNANTGAANNIRIRGVSSLNSNTIADEDIDMDFEKINIEYSILCRFELK